MHSLRNSAVVALATASLLASLTACAVGGGVARGEHLTVKSQAERVAHVSQASTPLYGGIVMGPDWTGWPDAGQYPAARRSDHMDEYFGTRVADPYRWMEETIDGEFAPPVREWIETENSITMPLLKALPARDRIKSRLEELINYERYQTPSKMGGRYFWLYNPGMLNQNVLYVADALDATPRVLIDPNTFSDDGTISLGGTNVSWDGQTIAYGTSDGGSDWRTWKFRRVADGAELKDTLEHIKFATPSWTRNNKGVYYSRFPVEGAADLSSANENMQVWYHEVGTDQTMDELIFATPDHPRRTMYPVVTEDGKYLVVIVAEGFATNALYYAPIDRPKEVVRLLDEWDAQYQFVANDGPVFYISTTHNAPNYRVIAIDTRNPAEQNWKTIIAERPEAIDSISYVGGRFLVTYIKDARSVVKAFERDGSPAGEVTLPAIGTATGFGGVGDDPETFYQFASFTNPSEIYRYDASTGKSTLFKRPAINVDFDAYEVSQHFYASKDGTKVPMFIVHKKGIKLDGSHPTLLYGYGGFNVSLTPTYSTTRMVWLDMGGILAIPNLRGGGEYGEAWHLAGTKLQKQNVFDDFIAAAEFLIDKGYTNPKKLAIQGGSNGGLLVGAVMLQRPELFGACLPAVGVMDMLRFHTATIGRAWGSDYGLSEVEEEFHALAAYSPVHNIKPACYPPTLITTADRDDRVVPWHSFKFAAEVQHQQRCDNPVLIRIETRAGHGAGTPLSMVIEEYADVWAFLHKALDMGGE